MAERDYEAEARGVALCICQAPPGCGECLPCRQARAIAAALRAAHAAGRAEGDAAGYARGLSEAEQEALEAAQRADDAAARHEGDLRTLFTQRAAALHVIAGDLRALAARESGGGES